MPDLTLPTITLTDAQANCILAAFKAKFGTTTTEDTLAAYREWLQEQVASTVLAFEEERLRNEYQSSLEQELSALRGDLPFPPAPPAAPETLTAEELERQAIVRAQLKSITGEEQA